MKKALLFLLLLSSIGASAKKRYVDLEELTGIAELILTGEIIALGDTTYTFKITETLKGKTDSTITIQRFKNWKCDHRYAEYKVGEKLCVFLRKWKGEWATIGGTDGEKPIVGGFITPYGIFGPDFDNPTISIGQFTSTLKDFMRCFSYIGQPYEFQPLKFKQLVSNTEAETFSKMNWLSLRMYMNLHNTEEFALEK